MNIVTGYTGQPHVTSNAVQGFNQGIFGTGNYVLNVGNKFNAVLTGVNTVTISDGEGVLQGVHFRIDPGTTEDVNIANGTTGYKRIDFICARYTKNALTGVESVNLVVVEGTPAASTPTEPTINTGEVLLGGSPVDFPLYEVDLNGLTPTIKSLFTVNGLIADAGDWYILPATIPTIANLETQVRLLINPVLKLMDLNLLLTPSASISDPGIIVTELPITPYYSIPYQRTNRYFTLHGENASTFISHANLYSVDEDGNSITPFYHSVVSVHTNLAATLVYGHILTPYTKLCDAHPFSEAVKVIN